MDANELIEGLIDTLDKLQAKSAAASQGTFPDAIDAELARPPRVSQVTSVRESPEIQAFRTELVDGLIRADTARNLIALVNTIAQRLI